MHWRQITRLAQRDSLTAGLITGAVVVWLIAIYFVFMGSRGVFGGDASASSSAPSALLPSPPPPATAKPRPKPPKPKPIDVNACVAGLFPEESFSKPPSFDFVCSEADPVKGGLTVKSTVIKGAAGSTSKAMRDWVKLGWYEMLAFSLLRAKCCNAPPALKWSFDISCPVDKPLKRFEKAVRAKDTGSFEKIFFEYAEEIRCLSRFGQAPDFNQGAPPGSGVEIVRLFLERGGLKPP